MFFYLQDIKLKLMLKTNSKLQLFSLKMCAGMKENNLGTSDTGMGSHGDLNCELKFPNLSTLTMP